MPRTAKNLAPKSEYKHCGVGRETHKMNLGHCQQTKNMLVSYSARAQGVF